VKKERMMIKRNWRTNGKLKKIGTTYWQHMEILIVIIKTRAFLDKYFHEYAYGNVKSPPPSNHVIFPFCLLF
jgi:hypothetical protein